MDEENNSVPEFNVANIDGGSEKLNADPISEDTSQQIDRMLDEAEAETGVADTQIQDKNQDISGTYSRDISSETSQQKQLAKNPDGTFSGTDSASPFQMQQIDPEIAAIEQPRNLSEKNQSNWRKLQETASTYKRQAAEAQQLKQQLAQQAQQAQQTPLPADYEELRNFRKIFDIKNDPDFKTKYEGSINSAKNGIYNILRRNGAPEDVIKSIEEAGGPDKVDQNWWKKNAIDKLPMLDGELLKKNLVDVVSLKAQQEQDIENAVKNSEQYFKQKEEQQYQWYGSETENIYNHVDKLTENFPWARFQEIPPGANDEQIKKIQAHNKSVYALKQKFDSALWPNTAQERANIAAAATFSHVLTNQLRMEQKARNEMSKTIERLTAENNMLKGASKVPRPGNSSTTTKSNNVMDRLKMSSADAIDLGLDEAGE